MLKIPPLSKKLLSNPKKLIKLFKPLLNTKFELTKKTRTDGSNVRKMISAVLCKSKLPAPCPTEDYNIVPPGNKGVPKILREYLDTYIVTTENSYNLQVWNRNPNSKSIQVEYSNGDHLYANDIRFVFVRINPSSEVIDSIIILTPKYIVEKFGKFGKPTIKHQMIIPPNVRKKILKKIPPIIYHNDNDNISDLTISKKINSLKDISLRPVKGQIYSLSFLNDILAKELIGIKLNQGATKTQGQELENIILTLLGYDNTNKTLVGSYPDIINQALEVKVQESPTIDLGKFSPQFEVEVENCPSFMTKDIRYLIALTNPNNGIIEGVVLCPGVLLGNYFSYVSDTSYKCQRSIPMSFFNQYSGKVIYNP